MRTEEYRFNMETFKDAALIACIRLAMSQKDPAKRQLFLKILREEYAQYGSRAGVIGTPAQ